MDNEIILAIAAVIAEEEGIDIRKVRIITVRATAKNSLERFIEEYGIKYKKYQLRD